MGIILRISFKSTHDLEVFNCKLTLEDEKDFEKLVDLCHSNSIKIFMDFVPNHISAVHPYFREALQSQSSEYRSWFYFKPDNSYLCFFDVKELPKVRKFSELRFYSDKSAKP
jgi:glycosidase